MIPWINVMVLLFSSLLFLYFYVRSVSPAAREVIIGPKAYAVCARERLIAMFFELITAICYGVYYFYPLPTPMLHHFPWPWWISLVVGVIIGFPATALMVKGLIDAGEETAIPKKEHLMYTGIYEFLRHPQAAGEVFLWLAIAFLLNSPFLVIFSFIYFPIFLIMCFAEENDLLLRYGNAYAAYIQRVRAFIPVRKHRQKI